MDKFQQSVSFTLQALQDIRSHGHTQLRSSIGSLSSLVATLPEATVAKPAPPSTTTPAHEVGSTSAQLRAHFARKNATANSTPSPSSQRMPRSTTPLAAPLKATAAADPLAPSTAQTTALTALQATTTACQQCPILASSRSHVVFGAGNPNADLLFIGEAPKVEEDRQGEPFVGPAGELLTKIIAAMGMDRSQVYLTNVLKCRPDVAPGATGDRPPSPQEIDNCLPYLRQQIKIIQPKAVIALGGIAMEGLFGLKSSVDKMRGRWHMLDSIPVMATYPPSYLIERPELANKRALWEDMLKVMERLALPISQKQQNFFCPPPTR